MAHRTVIATSIVLVLAGAILAFPGPSATTLTTQIGYDEPPLVPGTTQPDLQAMTPRTWSIETPSPTVYRFTGTPEDPAAGTIAADIHTGLGIMEMVHVTDESEGIHVTMNIGAVHSTVRFEPPLPLDTGQTITTIDVPRLQWNEPVWLNDTMQPPDINLQTTAPVPLPDETGTSPPVGIDPATADPSGLNLTWRIMLTEQHDHDLLTGPWSPGGIRFSWTLTGAMNDTIPPEQQITWRFRYDYEMPRPVERPQPSPQDMLDGAYIVMEPYRATLRLVPKALPETDDQNETIQIPRLNIDVYPSAGGPGPGPEPERFPPPMIVEGTATNTGFAARGVTIHGQLAFLQTTPADDEDDPLEDGSAPPTTWPVTPRIWQVLLPVTLALLSIVPRLRSDPSTNP